MSEKLTIKEQMQERSRDAYEFSYDDRVVGLLTAIQLAEEYAVQQVQRIKEERDKAIRLALSYRSGNITDPEKDFEAMEFLTSTNKVNG